jgi:SAM-dependent methyltransferase
MPSEKEARGHPTGSIELAFCRSCGFVWNQTFDPRQVEYSSRYEETQGYSPTFNEFHEGLARRLVRNHGLIGKDVLEIGCGKGEFLALLARLGGNRALGFDPGYAPGRHLSSENITVVQELFTREHERLEADLIVCKMTLEHVHEPRGLFHAIRAVASNRRGTGLFILVPDATRILQTCAFEDIYYEHCSYFTPGSLTTLLNAFRFSIQSLNRTYGGQYLAVEAQYDDSLAAKGEGSPREGRGWPEDMADAVAAFPEEFSRKAAFWARVMRDHADNRRHVALWGSGSKAVSFLSTVPSHGAVKQVVDINPHRQGHFMPGSGQPIVPPDHLSTSPPECVVVMNPIYRQEVSGTLESLRLYPEVVALGEEAL